MVTKEILSDKVGEVITFFYPDQKTGGKEVRSIELEEVKECANGNIIAVGLDNAKNRAYRSFNLSKMQLIG